MNSNDTDHLFQKIKFIALNSDQVAYEPGWNCDYFFMCLTGRTRVYKRAESGREILLYHVKEGETCVLTTSCLLTGQQFPASSIAEQETHLAAIPATIFYELMGSCSEFRSFVLDNYGQVLPSLIALVDQVAFERIDQRLAKHLIRIANEQNIVNKTQQELALDLGSVREVIGRYLQNWETLGLIITKRGKLEILDTEGLVQHTNTVL